MTPRANPSASRKRHRKTTLLATLHVHPRIGDKRKGLLQAGGAVFACALGSGGVVQVKREGDGGSPRGRFRLRGGAYRPDHLSRPGTALPLRRTAPGDGWCDDVRDRRYNRPIPLPAPGVSAERMWRDDGLYDVVIDLDHNRGADPSRPRIGDLPAHRPAGLRADRRMRRAQARRPAASAASARTPHPARDPLIGRTTSPGSTAALPSAPRADPAVPSFISDRDAARSLRVTWASPS